LILATFGDGARFPTVNPSSTFWLSTACFAFTYFGLALGRIPGLRIDRAGISLVGATLVLVLGVLPLAEAIHAVDYDTILLLFGMMVLVSYLRLSGFFKRLSSWTLNRVRTPLGLLAVTVALSGLLSAFLVNDIVCLALTPLVIHLARRLRLNPVPHLIGLATAANIGSVATITGNPQNMIIGSLSHIPYGRFAAQLAPLAVTGLLIDFLVIAVVYRGTLLLQAELTDDSAGRTSRSNAERRIGRHRRPQRWLLWKSVVVMLATVILFLAGMPIVLVALGAASLLLLGRVRPEKIYRQIDWSLLVMFCGLFVVVHGFEVQVVQQWEIEHWGLLLEHPLNLLSLVCALLSNVVSNVPAVLLFKPIIPVMPAQHQESAWLALAMSSTFAGNLSILGSVANLIVVENARREGTTISFWEYCQVGIPVTCLTLLMGVSWLFLIR
jgi:Na+/H+ antiporter NhaD/arsenite permease-like protein